MKYNKEVKSLCDRIIYGGDPVGSTMNIDNFNWVEGVGMYGILRAWQIYGFEDCKDMLLKWIDKHKGEADKAVTVNAMAPVMTMLEITDDQRRSEVMGICQNTADFIMNKAPRTQCGAFEHTVNEDVKFGEQVWADTLFMVCMFLAKYGKATWNEIYTKEAQNQLYLHHKYLKDKETGLFFHGYSCIEKGNLSCCRWGRANAWITASTVEMLEIFPDEFEHRGEIIASLQEQVAALEKYQRENGMFGTVIDEECYDEASATAGFGYGILRGIKSGFISEKYMHVADKAKNAILQSINDKGEVMHVSSGTPIHPTIEQYKQVEILPTLYGQALSILLLSEYDR